MKTTNTKKYKDVENPSNKKMKKTDCSKCWIIPLCICLSILIGLICFIIFEIVKYFHDTEGNRTNIDNRYTHISYNVIDYEIDPNIDYNCTNMDQCKFKCSYIKNNLHEERKSCEYDDWLDFWKWFLIVWGILIICSCICGGGLKAKN